MTWKRTGLGILGVVLAIGVLGEAKLIIDGEVITGTVSRYGFDIGVADKGFPSQTIFGDRPPLTPLGCYGSTIESDHKYNYKGLQCNWNFDGITPLSKR